MKDTADIPTGIYCDGCKYYHRVPCLTEQENGYCEYLGKSDWDINREDDDVDFEVRRGDTVTIVKGKHLPNMSLLWDGCKECGVNDD